MTTRGLPAVSDYFMMSLHAVCPPSTNKTYARIPGFTFALGG
jgi:hypothetical protein